MHPWRALRSWPWIVAGALWSCGGSPPTPAVARDPAALLAEAAEHQRSGDLAGAMTRAEAALAAGGGRDAGVQVAELAIRLDRLDRAAEVLQPLVDADRDDAIAQYDLALVQHRRSDYNGARAGYLAALRADPRLADARYNLALLCWEQGVHEEARHHAERFTAAFPDDPRGAELARTMASGGARAR